MSVGLYRDVHVPAAITRGLLLRGVDALTAQLDGTTELEDPDLLNPALNLDACSSPRTKTYWPKRPGANEVGSPSVALSTLTSLASPSVGQSAVARLLHGCNSHCPTEQEQELILFPGGTFAQPGRRIARTS